MAKCYFLWSLKAMMGPKGESGVEVQSSWCFMMIYCLFSLLNTVSLRSSRKECIKMMPLFLRVLLALQVYKVLLESQEARYHLSNFAFLLYLSLLFIKPIGNIRMACAMLATNLPSAISNILNTKILPKTTLNIMQVKTTICIQQTLYTNTYSYWFMQYSNEPITQQQCGA